MAFINIVFQVLKIITDCHFQTTINITLVHVYSEYFEKINRPIISHKVACINAVSYTHLSIPILNN